MSAMTLLVFVNAGRHKVDVQYADTDIKGSPFYPEAYDASKVKVGPIGKAILGQALSFPGMCYLVLTYTYIYLKGENNNEIYKIQR